MPLNNRYVVAAFDAQEERLAFISPSFEWVQSARSAAIFQSQIDANYFIKKNDLGGGADPNTPDLTNFDHARPIYVTVDIRIDSPDYDPAYPNRGISFSGIG